MTRSIGFAIGGLLLAGSVTALRREKSLGPIAFLVGTTIVVSMLAIAAMRRRKEKLGASSGSTRAWRK